ncbi:MAG: bifunctional DNA-formamidopyrimidine glycosylase/DNA-(apurinic or apyrimidinic site) lyase [Acidobacteriaceae bacterium]
MPELPEVETVVSELRPKLKNKTIKAIEVRLPKMISIGPRTMPNVRSAKDGVVGQFVRALVGKKITDIDRRAKLIIIDIEGKYSILIHLKMTGQLIYLSKKDLAKQVRLLNIENYPKTSLPAKSTHVIFDLSDGSRLFYNDMRQFGYLKLVTDKELPDVKELNEFGPEPLSKDFTFEVFERLLKRRAKAQVKPWLTDPKIIAGIGNIYSDEILFFAKIKPTRVIQSLSDFEKTLLFEGIKTILMDAVKHYGSSVGDFVRPSGDWGKYGLKHKVYGREGKPCKACGSTIKSIKFNGRTGSFCPHCQK